MAIACDACGKPVHEQAVRCPHCGDLTGVPVDPIAAAEISVTATAIDLPSAEPLEARVVSAIVDVVSAAIELVKPERSDDDPVPRATARTKRS